MYYSTAGSSQHTVRTPNLTDTDRPDTPDDEGQRDDEKPRREAPAPPRAEPDGKKADPSAPMTTVPNISPGTAKDPACDSIEAAKLRCEPVEVGTEGALGTVRDTDPPGGYKIAENATVRVHVYGGLTVPKIVDLSIDDACTVVEGGTAGAESGPAIRCKPQAEDAWTSDFAALNVVMAQEPEPSTSVSAGSTVTAHYADSVEMPNLVDSVVGQQACNDIVGMSGGQIRCTLVPGGEAPSPAYDGLVSAQSIQFGSPVRKNDTIQLTVYGAHTQRVPEIPVGTEIQAACQLAVNNGYGCDYRYDGLARTKNTLTAQEPAPGTAQVGGNIVLHYNAYDPQPVYRWKQKGDDVYVLRLGETIPNENYVREQDPIGYSYGVNDNVANSVIINGFYCAVTNEVCGGHKPNHYLTREGNARLA